MAVLVLIMSDADRIQIQVLPDFCCIIVGVGLGSEAVHAQPVPVFTFGLGFADFGIYALVGVFLGFAFGYPVLFKGD